MIKMLVTGACGVTSRSVVRSLNKSEFFKDKIEFIGTDICNLKYAPYEGLYKKVYYTGMFRFYHGAELDVSSFDTSNVTDMNQMFLDCWYLKELDLSNFNTINVTDMSSMFSLSENIESLDISSFDTSNVTDMERMFYDCRSLESIIVGDSWSTKSVENYIMLLIGISFVMLLISMAVGMPETLSYYQEKMCDMTFASEQIILSSTEDEYGNLISTETDGAERFSINSLERKSDSYNEEIPVYGIESGSRYVNISPTDYGSVYISKAFAEKYNVHPGETIILSEKYEHKDYRWTVYDIYDYSAGVAVFMENGQFNMEFNKKDGEFSGYMSDKQINDIDTKYIAKEITTQDMIMV